MDQINAILEREEELLETLLFKLVAVRLLLESGELRFLSRATREVERARTRTREVDLVPPQLPAGPVGSGSPPPSPRGHEGARVAG